MESDVENPAVLERLSFRSVKTRVVSSGNRTQSSSPRTNFSPTDFLSINFFPTDCSPTKLSRTKLPPTKFPPVFFSPTNYGPPVVQRDFVGAGKNIISQKRRLACSAGYD